MNYLKTINGDLLNATEDFVAHQCNCMSTNAKTLAQQLFIKYPYANTYKNRIKGNKNTYNIPGTMEIFGNGIDKRFIINIYSQYYPSIAKYNNDTTNKRLEWFVNCLNEITKINDIQNKTIAMPYNIGCGAAGGDWNIYHKIIEDFANKEKINITLYKLD